MFPIGKCKLVEFTKEQSDSFCEKVNKGIYPYRFFIGEYDIITNKKLVISVLPRRDEKHNLVWDLNDIEKGVYTHIDIERGINHGYKLTRIYSCLVWSQGAKVFYEYITSSFEQKKKSKKK